MKKNKVRQHKKDEFLEILQPYVRELRAQVNILYIFLIFYIFLSNKVCVVVVYLLILLGVTIFLYNFFILQSKFSYYTNLPCVFIFITL